MTDQYAEAREVIRQAEEFAARKVKAVSDAAGLTTRFQTMWAEKIARDAYIEGYSACVRQVTDDAKRLSRSAPHVAEVPALYLLSQDETSPAAFLTSGGVSTTITAAQIARAGWPSREAVGLLARLTMRAVKEGNTDEACELLGIALCMREIARRG